MSSRLLTAPMVGLLAFTSFLSAFCAGQNGPVIPRAPSGGRTGIIGNSPVNVSPGSWSQLAKLTPTGCCVGLENAAAVYGDSVVVGLIPLNPKNNQVANVFVKTAQGWRDSTTPTATLSGPIQAEPYIAPVAINGDTIVTAGNIGDSPGYAFVYVKPSGGWASMSAPTAVLTSSDNNPDFGVSVCVNGDTVVVGSDGYFSGSPGSAYVFIKPAGGWHSMTETAKLTSSDGAKYDLFGYSVSASGQTIIVGAPQFGNIQNPGPGKAYVFVQPSGGWTSMTQTAELDGSDSVNKDAFGFSVAVEANVVVAGAYVHNKFLGKVYVYQKPVSGWTNMTQTASLTPADSAIGEFGYAVAISGKIVVIGAPYRGLAPNGGEGAIYVFGEPAGGWQNSTGRVVLTGADAHFSDVLGFTVAISGKTALGGAPHRPMPGNAYIFGLP
jgi:hypothetical protein